MAKNTNSTNKNSFSSYADEQNRNSNKNTTNAQNKNSSNCHTKNASNASDRNASNETNNR